MSLDPPAERLCDRLGYRFRDPHLLRDALTHKSHLNEAPDPTRRDNERLEFLGDAVLDLIVSELFVHRFPDAPEGDLSKLKSKIVSETALARVAEALDLGEALALGRGEALTGGRQKPSVLGDALEAVIAAIYLDAGLEAARDVILRVFEIVLNDLSRAEATDYKTDLQELSQRDFDSLPVYTVLKESGPDHRKQFEIQLTIRGEVYGTGTGHSKKEAEQQAAKIALERIRAGHSS
ncbi:MAG: ribonuclease III [Nitrospiria bacterium]